MTPASLRPIFDRSKRNTGDLEQLTFYDFCDEINRFVYRVMYKQEPERFIVDLTLPVSPGTDDYSLSSDVETIDAYGCGLFVVENGVNTDRQLFKTRFGSQDLGYYLKPGYITFTPVPTASATYTLRYIPVLSPIEAEDDLLVIPDSYVHAVVKALELRYASWEEDPGMEGVADQRFARALDELAEHIRIDVPVRGIETYSQSFM